jgi:hypothetical protein
MYLVGPFRLVALQQDRQLFNKKRYFIRPPFSINFTENWQGIAYNSQNRIPLFCLNF